ncbi:MAG: hypothetical protein M1147_07435 [Nitrospirae bacterium]|nr:hypothetical protein [Nitrospirota bacterium]MCL5977944.1 hypothetical protein [Nitrospirota bacterium]
MRDKFKSKRTKPISTAALALAIVLMTVFIANAWAEYREIKTIPLFDVFGTEEKWQATIYEEDRIDELQLKNKQFRSKNYPIKICFWHDSYKNNDNCFKIIDGDIGFPNFKEAIKSKSDHNGLFLLITSNDGSDMGFFYRGWYDLSIWFYDKGQKNIVKGYPNINFSEQAQYKVIQNPMNKKGQLLIVADFIWGKNEGRYDKHKYLIKIYDISETKKEYMFIGSYLTRATYNSEDVMSKVIDVVESELENIKKLLGIK